MIQFPLCDSQIEQTWSFVLSPPEGVFSPSGWANLHLQRCWVYKNPKMSHQHTYPLECRRFWGNLDIHLRLLFPSPLSRPPLQSYWIVLKKFGLKLQKLFYLSCFVLHCFFAYSNFIVTRFRLRIQMSCLATSSCSNFQKLISQFPRSPSHCQHATSEDM